MDHHQENSPWVLRLARTAVSQLLGHVWSISMLLPRGWEGHWHGRRGTSRTTLTWDFEPPRIKHGPVPLWGRMKSHGRDPTPHASSLFVLIRSEVPCLSTVFCFFSFPSSWPLESYRHPSSASTELVLTLTSDFIQGFLTSHSRHWMGPQSKGQRPECSALSLLWSQHNSRGAISLKLLWCKEPESFCP